MLLCIDLSNFHAKHRELFTPFWTLVVQRTRRLHKEHKEIYKIRLAKVAV